MPKQGIILETEDIKRIIAEHYKVNVKNVIKSQYTYTVVTNAPVENGGEDDESSVDSKSS